MSKASRKETPLISLTLPTGPALAAQGNLGAMAATTARIARLCSYTPSNICERDRAKQKIESYIQKRLRRQREVSQITRDIASLLKTLRTNSGLNMRQVAEKLRVSFSYVKLLEDGKSEVPLSTFHAMLLMYGIDISQALKAAKTG